MKLLPRTTALLITGLAASSEAQTTWVVDDDGGPGIDFTTIQEAIDAAADGDFIRVEVGSYDSFRIEAKGLGITGQILLVDNLTTTVPMVEVSGLAAGQSVHLRGMRVIDFTTPTSAVVRVADCAGPVRIETLFVDSYAGTSLEVVRSDQVVLTGCLISTSSAATGAVLPAHGALVTEGSRLFAYDSVFNGGIGYPGGDGVHLVDSVLEAHEGTLRGGLGATGLDPTGCQVGGDGGMGLRLTTAGGPAPQAFLRDVALFGGWFGAFDSSCAPTPEPGTGALIEAGSLDTDGAEAPQLSVTGVVQAGTSAVFTLDAVPDDVVVAYAASGAAPALQVAGVNVFLPLSAVPVLSATATGVAQTISVPTPPLAPGAPAVGLDVQALAFRPGTGEIFTTGPSWLLLLP